jgi:putative membrane protein
MIDERNRMNHELTTLAREKGVALPRTTDYRAQFCTESLAGLSGAHFDRCYAKAQLIAHMEAVAAFEAAAERGQDPKVKSFAAKALPRIKEHLATIKPIAKEFEKSEQPQGEK